MADAPTPTTENVRRHWAGTSRPELAAAFDRWRAAEEKALRERIAQDIEADTMHCGPRDRCFACTNAANIARGATRG